MSAILISGVPRCGSTWVGRVLSALDGVHYIHEPDNEKIYISAYFAKRSLHRYPCLSTADGCDPYYRLWCRAFSGRMNSKMRGRVRSALSYPMERAVEAAITRKCRRVYSAPSHSDVATEKVQSGLARSLRWQGGQSPMVTARRQTVVVKSVHCSLSQPWIDDRFDIVNVVIMRDPRNVVASYIRMRLADALREVWNQEYLISSSCSHADLVNRIAESGTDVQRMALQVGLTYTFIESQLRSHPDWCVVKHETLCSDVVGEFRTLFSRVGLPWSRKTEIFLQESNRAGGGYSTRRVASEEVDKWKRSLSSDEIREISHIIEACGVGTYSM